MRDYIYEIYCLSQDIYHEENETERNEMIEELKNLIEEYQSF